MLTREHNILLVVLEPVLLLAKLTPSQLNTMLLLEKIQKQEFFINCDLQSNYICIETNLIERIEMIFGQSWKKAIDTQHMNMIVTTT